MAIRRRYLYLILVGLAVVSMGYTVSPYISIFMRTVCDDETQGAARTTLGVGESDDPCFAGLYVGDDVNYVEIDPCGVIVRHGVAQYWETVKLEPAVTGLPSANPATEDTYQEFSFHRYDKTTEESVYFDWTIPYGFATGSGSLRGHFLFFVENPPSGGGNENVRMGVEYKRIAAGGVFDFSTGTSSGTVDETIVDGEPAYTIHITDETTLNTTGWATYDTILFRFYRAAADGNDTYDNEVAVGDNDVWVHSYELEFLKDMDGEANE